MDQNKSNTAETFWGFVAVWMRPIEKYHTSCLLAARATPRGHTCRHHIFLPIRERLEWHFLQKKELDCDGNKQLVNLQSVELSKQCGSSSAESPISLPNNRIP